MVSLDLVNKDLAKDFMAWELWNMFLEVGIRDKTGFYNVSVLELFMIVVVN